MESITENEKIIFTLFHAYSYCGNNIELHYNNLQSTVRTDKHHIVCGLWKFVCSKMILEEFL
jgi:hypothetical protein